MKPIVVHRGTNDRDGKFIRLKHPGQQRKRFRVDLWIRTGKGDLLKDEISTKGPVRLNDLLEHHIKPNIDALVARANLRGGVHQHGFEIYEWG